MSKKIRFRISRNHNEYLNKLTGIFHTDKASLLTMLILLEKNLKIVNVLDKYDNSHEKEVDIFINEKVAEDFRNLYENAGIFKVQYFLNMIYAYGESQFLKKYIANDS